PKCGRGWVAWRATGDIRDSWAINWQRRASLSARCKVPLILGQQCGYQMSPVPGGTRAAARIWQDRGVHAEQQALANVSRLRLDIAYDGTNFHGWAKQPGLRTVQGELE